MDERDTARVAPSDADLERAIASVPGVVSASVRRSAVTGKSSLRIRLGGGEDAEKVSWAVAATLRERFSIVLDPDDIRPREEPAPQHQEPDHDPVRLIPDGSRPSEEVAPTAASASGPEPPTEPRSAAEADSTGDTDGDAGHDVPAAAAGRQPAAEPARPSAPAQREEPAQGEEGAEQRAAESIAEMLAALAEVGQEDPSPEPRRRDPEVSARRESEPDSEPEPDPAPSASREPVDEQAGEPGPASRREGRSSEEPETRAGSRPNRLPHVGNPWPDVPPVRPLRSRQPTRERPGTGERGSSAARRSGAASTPEARSAEARSAEARSAEARPAEVEGTEQPVRHGRADTSPSGGGEGADHGDREPTGSGAAAGDVPAPMTRVATRPTGSLVAVPGGMTGRVTSERAAIRHLDTERDERDVRVIATLEHGGRAARGEVTTVPTSHGVVRAVAEATIVALGVLVGPSLIAGVDRVCVQPADDPANVRVTVSLITDRGEETLLGASVVRGDRDHAVMRATLDALNRRVAELFPALGEPANGEGANDGSAA